MVNENLKFRPLYEDLFQFKPKLSSSAIIVYSVICGYYNYFVENNIGNRLLVHEGKTYLIWYQAQLAKFLCMHRDTISSAITQLEERGLLTIHREYTADCKESNFYIPNPILGCTISGIPKNKNENKNKRCTKSGMVENADVTSESETCTKSGIPDVQNLASSCTEIVHQRCTKVPQHNKDLNKDFNKDLNKEKEENLKDKNIKDNNDNNKDNNNTNYDYDNSIKNSKYNYDNEDNGGNSGVMNNNIDNQSNNKLIPIEDLIDDPWAEEENNIKVMILNDEINQFLIRCRSKNYMVPDSLVATWRVGDIEAFREYRDRYEKMSEKGFV